MACILSIQSWVAYGHVGNAAALFPLQRLGAEVLAIHTVQFSNHTGYANWTGRAFDGAHIETLIQGIEARGKLPDLDAVLSGYVGGPDIAASVLNSVLRVRAANPRALWCCDPVLGDDNRGLYVNPAVAGWLRDHAVTQADILTPNRFELAWLTGQATETRHQIRRAVTALQARMRAEGPRLVLVTSLPVDAERIGLLAASPREHWLLASPRLDFAPSGAGDLIAALFLFHILAGAPLDLALSRAGSALHAVLRATYRTGAHELAIIAAQDAFAAPEPVFLAERLPPFALP
jgi:pyridoxine kinase